VRNPIQAYFDQTYGYGWWNDQQLRVFFSRTYNAWKSNPKSPDKKIKPYPFVMNFRLEAHELDRRLLTLPEKLAKSIMRKAIKKGQLIWRDALRAALGKHRTTDTTLHLADNVVTHSRVYKRGKRRKIWAATGVRYGGATLSAISRAYKKGIKSSGSTRLGRNSSLYPGWRLHFIEGGTKRYPGRRYMDQIMAGTRTQVQAAIGAEVKRLVKGTTR
jgi:hypothetical protein